MSPESIARLEVKVIPGSSRSCIAGWLGDVLRVRVTAPPEKGKANAAVEEVIAEALGISRTFVQIVSGVTSPRKVIEITGSSHARVELRLGKSSG